MITITIYGKAYVAPTAIDNDAALLGTFESVIRAQLDALATAAGVPKTPIDRKQFTPFGEYEYDEEGEIKTVRELVWLTLPDALHDQVKVPTVADLLPPAPTPPAPAPAVVAPITDPED